MCCRSSHVNIAADVIACWIATMYSNTKPFRPLHSLEKNCSIAAIKRNRLIMRNGVLADDTEAVHRRRRQHRSTATRIAADVVLVLWTRMKFCPAEMTCQPRLPVEVEAAVVAPNIATSRPGFLGWK